MLTGLFKTTEADYGIAVSGIAGLLEGLKNNRRDYMGGCRGTRQKT